MQLANDGTAMAAPAKTGAAMAREFLFGLALLLVCIVKLVPFSPNMPSPTLESWAYAMNQAMAQGLALGTDIVFTFGPYSAIYTRAYHPFTDGLMLAGGLYLALMLWASCVGLMRQRSWYWQLPFIACFTLLASAIDALLFFIPLVAGMLVLRWLTAASSDFLLSRRAALYLACLFFPFGLLPLVKGSLLVLCVAISVLSAAFFWHERYRRLALICLLAPLPAMLAFWLASGQAVAGLPAYFTSMGPVISGYTDAMSISGSRRQVAVCLLPCVMMFVALWWQRARFRPAQLFLAALLFVFLFLSFKAGFVRQDAHVLICSEAVLLATLMLPFVWHSRLTPVVLVLALLSWSSIDRSYVPVPFRQELSNVGSLYASAWQGARRRLADPAWPNSQLQEALASMQAAAGIPRLPGSMDTYSYHQSQLFASGNRWSPRPVLQSYSAYTPALAEINRLHLVGLSAPEHIVFGIEAIDGRLPALEDGPSWPELLAHYRPLRMVGDTLLLQRAPAAAPLAAFPLLQEGDHALGQLVPLPPGPAMLYAQLDIRPSWFGRLAAFFFKPTELQITLEFADGHQQQFRLIPGMAKAGFILSPFIDGAADFALLYGRPALLQNKRVRSVTVAPANGSTWQWLPTYHATFRQVPVLPALDIAALRQFDHFERAPVAAPLTDCEGLIDDVKAGAGAPVHFAAGGLLKANGWLALSIAQSVLPDEVFLSLTDRQGVQFYAKAHPVKRPDVATYFKKPGMENAGYTVTADLNGMLGDYTLGLAVRRGAERKLCRSVNIPINIAE